MKRVWLFTSNTFEVQTRRNQIKALKLFKDFLAKLKASSSEDEDINQAYMHFLPVYEGYEQLYAQKDMVIGSYKGCTLNFEQEIAKMPEQLRIWEGKIHYYYPEDSIEDTILFPRRRTPFLQGTYDDRISAVLSLSKMLGDYTDLLSVVPLVQTYYNVLTAARDIQQQKEGLNDLLSSRLEAQRVLTAQEMFGCYGLLVYRFRYNPELILNYIDTSLLRYTKVNDSVVSFRGKVQTVLGMPIADAVILLPEIGTEAHTNVDGEFEVEVEAGIWRVEVQAEGYQTHLQLDMPFNRNARANFTLAAL